MSWSRFDDGYDEHEKIEDAWFAYPPNPVALHVMATTACNRWLSDGVVRPRWLAHKLTSAKNRAGLLADMVRFGLFDALSAGHTAMFTDSAGNEIVIGPFDEERYIVHDFLERHDSSVQIKERRRKDAERKRRTDSSADSARTPDGSRQDSNGTPSGIHTDSGRSRGRGRAGARAHPIPTLPNQTSPPKPPKGGRKRDLDEFEEACKTYGQEHFSWIGDPARAVRQAVTFGKAETSAEVAMFVSAHFAGAAA